MTELRKTALAVAMAGACVGWTGYGAGGQSFSMLYPGYSQTLFGVVSSFAVPGTVLGGVAVLQNGEVIAAECVSSNARLHRFSAAATMPGSTLHQDTVLQSEGGCGIVFHPNGFLYAHTDAGAGASGVVKIDPATGQTLAKMGPAGNALGIAVDPKSGHLFYAGRDCRAGIFGPTCTLFDLDPATGKSAVFEAFKSSDLGY